MSQYCGCATTQNKIKWALFAVFFLISAFSLSRVIKHHRSYTDDYNDCIEQELHCYQYNDGTTKELRCDDDYCHNKYNGEYNACIVYLVLFISFAVAATIPLYIMCCCTKKPVQMTQYYTCTQQQQPAIGVVTYTHQV